MPLPIAHGLLGASIVAALHPPTKNYALAVAAGGVLAVAADFDFLLVFSLDSDLWHRGFTHSIVFGLLVILLFTFSLSRDRFREAIAFGLAFLSHGILDFANSKRSGGVELLWPFSDERYVLGWWGLSEVPSQMQALDLVMALALEFVIFAPLFLLILMLRRSTVAYVLKRSLDGEW